MSADRTPPPTILIHGEQGYGDTIQFVRYVPMLAQRGATVILETAPALQTLFSGLKGVNKIVPAGMRPPDFDLHIPLLSLPRIFGTTLATVPNQVPYVAVSAERLAAWKTRINAPGGSMKVGLVWAGNEKPDPHRTCEPQNLSRLAQVQGVSFQSAEAGCRAAVHRPGLLDWIWSICRPTCVISPTRRRR